MACTVTEIGRGTLNAVANVHLDADMYMWRPAIGPLETRDRYVVKGEDWELIYAPSFGRLALIRCPELGVKIQHKIWINVDCPCDEVLEEIRVIQNMHRAGARWPL